MEQFFTYILQSELDGSFYIGQTSNVEQRLQYHNAGRSRYTSKKTPWKIVYYETFETRTEAIKRERFLKKQRNRNFYQKLIDDWSSGSAG